ncbi:MAG: GAF domain-containing protein [Chloroflexi bacterium]|nr:GAF domain-containing protein [Chloroflexota bacterium]
MQFTSEQLVEGIQLAVLVTDPEGTIIEANSTVLHMLMVNRDQLIGASLADYSIEGDISEDIDAINTIFDGLSPDAYIKEFVKKNGDLAPVEMYAGPLYDGDDISHIVFTIKPLSEEMRLLKELQRRNMHLLATSEVAKAATQILDLQEQLTRCVDLIRTHFGFYYAAIFLIDEAGEWAVLRAATGEAGQKLLENAHKLGVGSQSMVGWVTANNAARIALDVGEEAIRFDNPMLPKTRSEMALPLRVRGEVIGALDVQSTGLNAFSEEDIQTIQMMADQVAIAIDNARLFSERG